MNGHGVTQITRRMADIKGYSGVKSTCTKFRIRSLPTQILFSLQPRTFLTGYGYSMPPHQIETFLLDFSLYYSILQIQGKFLMNHLSLVHETSVSLGVVLLTRMSWVQH